MSNIELTAGRRRARQQATAKSFGRKLRRMGIRGEPVPPLGGRKAFLAHGVQEVYGCLRLFTGIYDNPDGIGAGGARGTEGAV